VTTVKAMAYAVKKPVVSVPTLDALAYNLALCPDCICPVMDARNNQVFTALYRQNGNVQEKITEYMGVPVSELVQIIKGKNCNVAFLGDAAEMHHDFLLGELGEKCRFAPPGLMTQKASSVAQLALQKAAAGELESSFDMVPFYLRKSQAEREYDKRNKGSLC
jgi:tRNA threonylcarbamoyladenosine biosynthesis protein TsaB